MQMLQSLRRQGGTSRLTRDNTLPSGRPGLALGLCGVQLVLAYEWLISGINKLADPNFTVQLGATLRQSVTGNPYSWYVPFLQNVVLPHASLFGLLVEVSEVFIGLALIITALVWIARPRASTGIVNGVVASAALLGAVFLSVNYFLQGGSTLPWIDAANAFQEGIDIDILIPLLAVVLLAANVRAALAARRRAQPLAASGRRTWPAA